MKKWQIENSEKSEISEISEKLFRVFFFPSFRFCPTAKIENSDLKNSDKKFLRFPRFPKFPSFRPGRQFSTFILQKIFPFVSLSIKKTSDSTDTRVKHHITFLNGNTFFEKLLIFSREDRRFQKKT